MSSKGLEMLRKHLSYYDFDPDKVVLLGNVLYYAKKAEFEFAGLEAENAKLLELVEDMLSCIEIRAAFGRPPTDEMYETFAQQARELGVEVDG